MSGCSFLLGVPPHHPAIAPGPDSDLQVTFSGRMGYQGDTEGRALPSSLRGRPAPRPLSLQPDIPPSYPYMMFLAHTTSKPWTVGIRTRVATCTNTNDQPFYVPISEYMPLIPVLRKAKTGGVL